MDDWNTFELFPVEYGFGANRWTGLHVKVKTWIRPKGYEGKDGMICLTTEAGSAEELDENIDELIAELQRLKSKGRKKFASLQKEET